jgi:hypothetical protein
MKANQERRTKKKEKEKPRKENKQKKPKILEELDLTAFVDSNSKKITGETIKKNKLPRETNGPTAKLVNIKNKVLKYKEKINRIANGKEKWTLRALTQMEKMGKLHKNLNIKNYDRKEEIKKVCEEARRISNQLAKIIYKNRNKYKREDFKKWKKETETEGW